MKILSVNDWWLGVVFVVCAICIQVFLNIFCRLAPSNVMLQPVSHLCLQPISNSDSTAESTSNQADKTPTASVINPNLMQVCSYSNRPFGVVAYIILGAGGLGSLIGPVKSNTVSPTARPRCDVSSELCCTGTKSWK